MSVAQRLLFLTTAFCLLLSAIIHVATFLDIAFYPAIFMVPLLFVIWPLVVWQWRRVPRRNLVLEIFGTIPRWMKILTGVLFAYLFANFLICYGTLSGGNPVRLEDGRYVIQKGQQILQTLDLAAFTHAQALQVRLLSGHLLAFYGLAMIALQAFHIKSSAYMADAKVKGP